MKLMQTLSSRHVMSCYAVLCCTVLCCTVLCPLRCGRGCRCRCEDEEEEEEEVVLLAVLTLSSCWLFRLSRAAGCFRVSVRTKSTSRFREPASSPLQRFSLSWVLSPSCFVKGISSCQLERSGLSWSRTCVQPVSAFLFVTSFVFSVFRWRQRAASARGLLCVVKLQTRRLLLCYLGLLWCSAGAKEMVVLRAVSSCTVSRAAGCLHGGVCTRSSWGFP
jgi:hypothetical protein